MASNPIHQYDIYSTGNFFRWMKQTYETSDLEVRFFYTTFLYGLANLAIAICNFSIGKSFPSWKFQTCQMNRFAWICITFTQLIIDYVSQYPIIAKIKYANRFPYAHVMNMHTPNLCLRCFPLHVCNMHVTFKYVCNMHVTFKLWLICNNA